MAHCSQRFLPGARLTVKQTCGDLGISRSRFYGGKVKGRVSRCFTLPHSDLRIRRCDLGRWLVWLKVSG